MSTNLHSSVCDGPNKVLGRHHEVLEEDPRRLVVEHRGRVNGNHLVVLGGEVVSLALQVSDLHEQAAGQTSHEIGVVVPTTEVCGDERQR